MLNTWKFPGQSRIQTTKRAKFIAQFTDVKISTPLAHGDLLESDVGQRHRGIALTVAKALWPRWFMRRFIPDAGLFMLIEARK